MKKLNFGCGTDIRSGWDNVDIQEGKGIIKSFDFNKFPYPIKEDMYDYIYLRDVLEHLNKPLDVINELVRISKDGGIIEIICPHYSNSGAYSSLDHMHFFNDTTFKQLEIQTSIINQKHNIKIISLELVPTWIGKFIFSKRIRYILSLFIGGLIADIHVRLRAIK